MTRAIAERERRDARSEQLAPRRSEVAPEPEAVDGEEADGADRGDRNRMLARPVPDRVREPEQDDDEGREQEQGRRVVREPRAEAHDSVVARHRAGDDRQPEHEQRVREERPEDRRLGDDDLAGRTARRGRRRAPAGSRASTAERRSVRGRSGRPPPRSRDRSPMPGRRGQRQRRGTRPPAWRPRSGGIQRRRRTRRFLRARPRYGRTKPIRSYIVSRVGALASRALSAPTASIRRSSPSSARNSL